MTTTSGALSHLKKAYEYIERLSESERSIYSCTRRAISEMIDVCTDIIEIGTCLIEECPPRTPNSTKLPSSNDVSTSMRLDKLEKCMESIVATLDDVVKLNLPKDAVDKSDVILPTSKPTQKDSSVKTPCEISEDTKSRKRQIGEFTEAFDMLSNAMKGIPCDQINSSCLILDDDVRTLGRALCDWYRVRILELDPTYCPFRYSISNILPYTQSIVESFSQAYMNDSIPEWEENFYHWMQLVKRNDASVSSYALPYDIFKTYKQLQDNLKSLSVQASYFFQQMYYGGLFLVAARFPAVVTPYGMLANLDMPSDAILEAVEDFHESHLEHNRLLGRS